MSIRIMTKQCRHCHRTYTYNPSTGDFGLVCPHCGKPKSIFNGIFPSPKKFPFGF